MKKQQQLGMNPGTARHRLVKDILWDFIVKSEQNVCHQCGKPMTKENFSIEHKKPWLDSEDPVGLFFSLDNIAYSHLKCNRDAARPPSKGVSNLEHGTNSTYSSGCRCEKCKAAHSAFYKDKYTPEERHARYKRTGK